MQGLHGEYIPFSFCPTRNQQLNPKSSRASDGDHFGVAMQKKTMRAPCNNPKALRVQVPTRFRVTDVGLPENLYHNIAIFDQVPKCLLVGYVDPLGKLGSGQSILFP